MGRACATTTITGSKFLVTEPNKIISRAYFQASLVASGCEMILPATTGMVA